MKLSTRLKLYWFAIEWYVRDVAAAILQEIAEAIKP